jgi:hypothetical protein
MNYIDFSKFNYNMIPKDKREEYIKRDKAAYAEILKNWIVANLDSIVERKWEITDIAFVKNTSNFIKPLKEAETLYELGLFTGCIALLGISAEDFTKYLALQFNLGELNNESQFKRLEVLLEAKIINMEIHRRLDDIRTIRNNCLHYDDDFKKKDDNELKQEALTVLNSIKEVIELTIGLDQDINLDGFNDMMHQLSSQMSSGDQHVKGFEDIAYRLRNAMSRLFNFDVTIKPGKKNIKRSSTYLVKEIDTDYEEHGEVTIIDIENGIPVCIDLDRKFKEIIIFLELKEGDMINATISSEISPLGMTGEWTFTDIRRV